MQEFKDYLRAYWGYVSNLGWGKAIMTLFVWLAGMFAPLAVKALIEPAKLASGNVDDWFGGAWLYFCSLRNVEGAPKQIEMFSLGPCAYPTLELRDCGSA